MLIGLNAMKTISRRNAPALDSWFGEEPKAEELANPANEMLAEVRMHKSLKSMQADKPSAVPGLPRSASQETAKPITDATPKAPAAIVAPAEKLSPYQQLNQILEPDSQSSRWLAHHGLLDKFTAHDCYVDISMAADGGFNAALRSTDGYRRTVVCRADGTSSQRITGPQGEEVLRFNSQGEPVVPSSQKRELSPAV